MVRVPLLDRGGQPAIGAGKLLDGGDGLGRHHGGRLVAFERDFPADRPRPIERMQRGVEVPARAVVKQPARPGGDIAGIGGMPLGIGERERVFRAGRKLAGVLQVGQPDDVVVSHCRASAVPCRRSS